MTESTLADRAVFTQVLQEIRDLGVAIAIDDFGTGYSSLARLSAFPVDVIKIDRSFVEGVQTPRGEAVLASIVTLAHATGAHVIAEGVETEAQLAALSALGVDSASGYLLARPAEPDHLPLPARPPRPPMPAPDCTPACSDSCGDSPPARDRIRSGSPGCLRFGGRTGAVRVGGTAHRLVGLQAGSQGAADGGQGRGQPREMR